jgi:hypothetical protein
LFSGQARTFFKRRNILIYFELKKREATPPEGKKTINQSLLREALIKGPQRFILRQLWRVQRQKVVETGVKFCFCLVLVFIP